MGNFKNTLINIGLGVAGGLAGGIPGAIGAISAKQAYDATKMQAEIMQMNLDITKQNYYGSCTGNVVDFNQK